MSLHMVEQLYQTLNTVAQTSSDPSADVSMVTAYNINLEDAQRQYRYHRLLLTLMPAQAEVSIRDLLTRTGQLLAILQEEAQKARLETLRKANQERQEKRGPRGTGV